MTTASNNQQYVQGQTSDNGRMRWRTTAAEETQWMVGNNDADKNNKKQKSKNVRRQRQRTCAAADAEDNDGW